MPSLLTVTSALRDRDSGLWIGTAAHGLVHSYQENANKQIADQLAITEDTVEGRVKSVLAKLDANDRTHAAIIGLKRGIIEL